MYEDKQKDLGSEFVRCVDAKLSSISRNPLKYQIVFKDQIRRALTKRFPYSIYFINKEDQITIMAILHQSQKQNETLFDESIGLN